MKLAFINGIILDGTKDMKPVSDKIIFVENGKIKDITDKNTDTSGYEIIDLKNQYIMPGLINMHVHLPASGKLSNKTASDPTKLVNFVTKYALTRKVALKLCEANAKKQLLSGTTTIRTVGGILNIDSLIRDRVSQNKTVGPRILAANMAISVEEGHMAGSLAYIATSEEHAKELVRKIAQDKPDIIKLMITGGVLDAKKIGEPGELKMPPEFVKAACDEAHKLNLKVAAHVESPLGVKVALENGVDTIEHGAKPDDEIISLFKKNNASLIATLSPALPFALFDSSLTDATEMAKENGKIVFEGIIECAKECLKNNIPVGLGTDTGCPFITQYDMWREVYYFKKYCGVSNEFALHTATLQNAKIAQIDHLLGSIEENKIADFIVTSNNPLEDLQALRNISMVVTNGKVIQNPNVKKFTDIDEILDRYL